MDFLLKESLETYLEKRKEFLIIEDLKLFRKSPLHYRQRESEHLEHFALHEEFVKDLSRFSKTLKSHHFASLLLSKGLALSTVRGTLYDLPCQARVDFFNPERGITSIQFTASLDYFPRSARQKELAIDYAFTRALIEKNSGHTYPTYVVVIEILEPTRCGVWRVSDYTLDNAENSIEESISELKRCKLENKWPSRFEDLRILEL